MTNAISHISRWLLMLSLLFTASACSSLIFEPTEEEQTQDGVINGLKLQLYIDVPSSRATQDKDLSYDDKMNQEGADNVLLASDIDIVFYTTDNRYVTHASGKDEIDLQYETPEQQMQHPLYHRYLAQLMVDGLSNNKEYRVVVLANKRKSEASWYPFAVKEVAYQAPAGVSMSDEQYLYDHTLIGNPGGPHHFNDRVADYTKWNLAGMDGAGVPMWGVQKMKIKTVLKDNVASLEFSNPDKPINLLRSIAKVRVELSDSLKKHVEVTPYQEGDPHTGCVLNYKHAVGFLAPKGIDAKNYDDVLSNLNYDNNNGTYHDGAIHAFIDSDRDQIGHAPFFQAENGAFYIYMYEHLIGEASINLQFHWTAESLQKDPVYHNYTLQFADYEAATNAAIQKAGGADKWKDRPLTDEELKNYKFPVMRNHYYVFTITKLNPLELKYEVCDWITKGRVDIEFGNLAEKSPYLDFDLDAVHEGGKVKISATTKTGAVITGVKINNQTASVTGAAGHYTASIDETAITGTTVTTEWTVTSNGETRTFTKAYTLPAKYWLISRKETPTRYATVDQLTNQTFVGINDTRNVNQINAIYKWVITKNPTGTNPVNETELEPGVTYYVFNAGMQKYIDGPTQMDISTEYMTVGGTPMTMKLTALPDGYYRLQFNNDYIYAAGSSYDKFGTYEYYTGAGQYILTPAIVRGEMPMQFTFGANAVLDGDNVKISATTSSGAVVNSVTIGGKTATKSGSGTSFTATVDGSSFTSATVTTVWNVTYKGDTRNFTKTYVLPYRYWLISHRDTRTRYVTVDQHSNQTYVGLTDARNVNEINAINKWVITTSSSGTNPVNVADLKTGVTYYLFNAGTQKYLSGYPSSSANYFTVGGTALTVTLVNAYNSESGRYMLKVNNAVYLNKKGNNADLVGPWTGTGLGNNYYLTPAVMKGAMPLSFTFGTSATNSGGQVKVTATIGSGAVINSVKIGDVAATVTNSGTTYTATFNTASLTNPAITVVWNVTYQGETRNYTKSYTLPTKYWLISHISNPTRYATIGTNDQGAEQVGIMGPADSRAVDDIEAAYKWIITRNGSGTATPICETALQTGVTYYLYNVGTKRYITGPTSGSAVSMTTSTPGSTVLPMIMKLAAYGTGTYRICWNNNASYGNPYGGGSVGPGRFGAWTKYRSPDSCYKFTEASK